MRNVLSGVEDFFDTYWEQEFLHLPRQVAEMPVRLDDIDHLLSDHLLTTNTVAMSAFGHLIDEARFTIDPTPLAARSLGPQQVVDPDRLLAEFQRGATVAFQRVEDFLPRFAQLAQELTAVVGHPVRGNVYLTPPGSPGLGMHVDGSDVFVIQCEGTKRWEIWEREMLRPLVEDKWRPVEVSEPDHVVDLHPGDLLYLPRGWRHRVGAGSETSLSATFALRTVTRAHVARAAVDKACRSESFRLALEPRSMQNPEACAAEVAVVLADLSVAIAKLDPADVATAVGELVHQVRLAKPSTTIKSAIAAIALTDNHRLRIATGVEVEMSDQSLCRGAEKVVPPSQFIAALERAAGEPVRVVDLRGVLPLEAVEPLLLKLVDGGWLRAA